LQNLAGFLFKPHPTFKDTKIMSLDTLKEQLPDYAKDIRLNLTSIRNISSLTPVQLWGTAVASAHGTRSPEVIAAVEAEAAQHLDEAAFNAARAAAALMAMNNVYYRFVHLVKKPDYGQMRANLRMNIMANPGVDKHDFEMWSLAVSAINGCGMCIESHEANLAKEGATKEMIQDAVRIAAILNATAATLVGAAHCRDVSAAA